MTAALALGPGTPMSTGATQEPRICGAKTRAGGKCKGKPMHNGRCRIHGGLQPVGPSSASWRHGRYSKYMPANLLARATELAQDPDVLSLVPNLLAVDAQLAMVYEEMADPAKAEAWAKLHDIVEHMNEALSKNSSAGMMSAFLELQALDKLGVGLADVRERLADLHEQRRKLVDTEAKRLSNEHAAVSYDRAMGVVLLLVDIMFRHVVDAKVRRRIIDDVRALEMGKGQPVGALGLDAEAAR